MTTPTQQQWREMMTETLGAWTADTAGEIISKEAYAAAEQMIADSLAAERGIEIGHAVLQQIMPSLPAAKRGEYLPWLNKAMIGCAINTPLRAAAFLAQIAHESAELKFMEEIWGRTKQQLKYEPPSDLAKRLGNTQTGDGFKYRGRGPIQITGRGNYRKYGDLLGVDFIANPDLAADPKYAFQTAALFFSLNGCNELADAGDFVGVTRKINGGTNGMADRQRYYEIAKKVLGVKA